MMVEKCACMIVKNYTCVVTKNCIVTRELVKMEEINFAT